MAGIWKGRYVTGHRNCKRFTEQRGGRLCDFLSLSSFFWLEFASWLGRVAYMYDTPASLLDLLITS
jgi:hypothetical protein